MKTLLKRWFLVLLTCQSLAACATLLEYSAEPIEAWVVDEETKQPIEGTVVVAHWVLEGGIHVDRVGELMVMEAVTDKTGRFYFPPWGPVKHSGRSRLTYMDPELIIFKSGYKFLQIRNDPTKEAIEGKYLPVRRSKWNGKTIKLESFKGDLKATRDTYDFLSTALGFAIRDPKECLWKKVPKMIIATMVQEEEFRARGLDYSSAISSTLIRNDGYFREYGGPECGSPVEFLKGVR